jgi:ATP-binding cassette subfamily B (MDR/TAP) protein 1
MSGGDVLAVFFAVLIGAFALGQASPSVEAIGKGQGVAYKIFETIERASEIDPSSTKGIVVEEVKGHIQLKKIKFHYPSRPDAQVGSKENFAQSRRCSMD